MRSRTGYTVTVAIENQCANDRSLSCGRCVSVSIVTAVQLDGCGITLVLVDFSHNYTYITAAADYT